VRTVLARLVPSWLVPSWLGEGGGADPFETLALQSRLSRLAREMRALDDPSSRGFGTWHHTRAAQEAYERTLDDACRLARVDVEPGRGAAHRLIAEAMLESAGWRW
jgi:hypothetical protein